MGEKPNVSHFKIFGNLVYIHVPEEKRTKLAACSLKVILVNYSESSKLYVPSQRKIVASRDVKVDEDAWSSKPQQPLVLIEEEATLASPSVET